MEQIGIPLEGFAEFSKKVASEGAVLLKNEGQILPIKETDTLSLFGRTQINYYRTGTGSGGNACVTHTTNILEGCRKHKGLHINEDLASLYEDWTNKHPFDNGGGLWAAEPLCQKEMPLTLELVKKAREHSNKAIVVIGRTSGEEQDHTNSAGSYQLSEQEKDMLHKVTSVFEEVVVLLNVSGILDMNWVNEPLYAPSLKGILYLWQGGMEGGAAAADLLAGSTVPSGKLTDTIAYAITDYPSASNYGDAHQSYYEEDIYVGYRYFETFAPSKVQYAFGYGLSYTQFEITPLTCFTGIQNGEKHIQIKVCVKNIGASFAGKEVVQVYYSAPQGKLGRPAKELVCFKKTGLLQPGEEEILSLSFPISQMATYDDAGITGHPSAYVLEAGDYTIYVGNSIRNVTVLSIDNQASYHQPELEVILQLEECLAPTQGFKRIKPAEKNTDGTYSIGYEDVPTATISLAARIEENLPTTLPIIGNKGYTLKDVHAQKVSMEDFVSQLTASELATIVRGEGMGSPLVTPGTASAFGGVSDSLASYEIPVACCADGPSGIRMANGLYSTQIPIGTLLAATWDTALIEELGHLEGKELVKNHVDLLLGPGLNIHRYPLNGRNFEYFSEDPFITGSFATALTKGIEKGGAHATLKHFACNNQETARHTVNAIVSERALREIYLKGFEMAVKDGGAKAVMTSYNPLNGHWTSSNYDLNTTILRKEWGFKGIVMTDWWAKINDVVNGREPSHTHTNFMVRSQNDLYMVINNYGAEVNSAGDNTLSSLENGSLELGELQRSAMNICSFLMTTDAFTRGHKKGNTLCSFRATSLETTPSEIHDLSSNASFYPVLNGECLINVPQDGIYAIIVHLMCNESNLAQTSCNLYLNKKLATTIETNGTWGRWVKQKLINVQLEAGVYEIGLEVVKAGMELNQMTFELIETTL